MITLIQQLHLSRLGASLSKRPDVSLSSRPRRWRRQCLGSILLLALTMLGFSSCRDDYAYDNEEPTWLGSSVYDWLRADGHYATYLTLIDRLGLDGTLARTGSKTLFPATDDAYARYFSAHGLNGSSPTDIAVGLTRADANYLFNASMLNMAYLDKMLANVPNANSDDDGEGMAVLRDASSTIYDRIRHFDADRLPATKWWARFAQRGGAWIVDNEARPDVIFTPAFMQKRGITEADWELIGGGAPYEEKGFYVNGARVREEAKNTTCKNGYLHPADEVVTALPNMAELIEDNAATSLFALLMNKFSAPYYDADIDVTVRADEMNDYVTDTVYVRRYFNDNAAGACTQTPQQPGREAETLTDDKMLYFDPAYNRLGAPTDMGVMLVPTDEAMRAYWNGNDGAFLRKVYGTWDNVPIDVLCKFIKNHQLKSFVGSLPNDWDNLADQKGNLMNVRRDCIVGTAQGCNGLVYFTNTCFPPIDYKCAYAPTLTSPVTRVMKAAIDENDELKFHLYLRSLENQYNLLVPTDSAVRYYAEPISWSICANTGVDNREIWGFRMGGDRILADVYAVNPDGSRGALQRTIGTSSADQSRIQNRLRDIIDAHIVVADTEDEPMSGFMDAGDKTFYLTKGGTVIRRAGGRGLATQFAGVGDAELGLPAARLADSIYVTTNSHTFFIDRILQDPARSVYTTLRDNAAYSRFFQLLLGDPAVYAYFKDDKDVQAIFDQQTTEQSSGVGQTVTSFNNYRYTVLVPTNEAIEAAFRADADLWTWEQITMEDDPAVKKARCLYLLNFLRFHFIDGAVPVGTGSWTRTYYTAARRAGGQFIPVTITSAGDGLTFGTDDAAHVVTSDPALYNVWARDLIVDNKDPQRANNILASSRAVIHVVDRVAPYNK